MTRVGSIPEIVCFGDSLTAGYQSPDRGHPFPRETPYGSFLQERLASRARVTVRGVCGELTGEMALRFRRDVLDHRPDSVVILGGTNDLGWNAEPPEIMRNLVKMHEQALHAGIQSVAVTVPSVRLGDGAEEGDVVLKEYVRRRRTLNGLMLEYADRRRVPCVDLFLATSEPGILSLAAGYSNDGLHLTTVGYALLATLLYEQVFAARF